MPVTTQTFRCSSGQQARVAEGTVPGGARVRERIITVPNTPRFHIGGVFAARFEVNPDHRDDITLRFVADERVLPYISARRCGGLVHLELRDGVCSALSPLTVEATVGPLTEVASSGAADVALVGLCGAEVRLTSSGASTLRASGDASAYSVSASDASRVRLHSVGSAVADRIRLDVDQTGRVEVGGRARELELFASGRGRVVADAPAFEAERVRVQLSGVSEASVRARHHVSGRTRFPARLRVDCAGRVAIDGPYR